MRDQFGREIDYIRISVTDRCNLRCSYCMPEEGVESVGHDEILRFDEIVRIVKLLAVKGIKHVKITGGEPLVRKGIVSLISDIKGISGIEDVTLTTNGVLLADFLDELAEAGVSGINISLDTLNREKYEKLTGQDKLESVLNGISKCLKYPNISVKINMVTLAGVNDDEVAAFAGLAKDNQIDVRFIEMMPVGMGKGVAGFTQDEIIESLEKEYGKASKYEVKRGNGPAKYYEFEGFKGKIGFISAMSHKFCNSCNRIRLTSEGFLKTCLQFDSGIDLKELIRDGESDMILSMAVEKVIFKKPKEHHFGSDDGCDEKRGMSFIGG